MIRIEFPEDNKKLAGAIGRALSEYSGASGVSVACLVETYTDAEERAMFNNEGDAVDNTSSAKAGDRSGGELESDAPALQTDDRVDTKNVVFNAQFCGKAAIPFYASGKNKGQWKRRGGVPEEEYNAWYADQLANHAASTVPATDDTGLDTAAAFSDNSSPEETVKPAPRDCGEFMGWVSNQQAAGHLNQHDITDAYATLKLEVTDLFPPNTPDVIATHVGNLFAVLGGLE